ncbi:MAG: LysR family transcriptional regulator [Limnobacter sp.]|nr:LysR family transcriptional regulator [Limnobacter sp.]
MPLSLEALALLELIETRGSFAAAALALNKAPSAITYQLRQLEEALDVLVYDRSGHKARLTPAGRVLLEEGRRLLLDSERIQQKVKAVASGWEPEFRVVKDALVPLHSLLPWVRAFDALQAPTRLRFSTEVLSGTWEALYSGRADLLIGSQLDQNHFSTSTGLHTKEIGHAEFAFAVAPCHPLAQATEPLDWAEVAMHRAVAVGDTSRNFKPLTFGIASGQAVLTVPTLEDKIQAQAAGLGCGWVPEHLAAAEFASGRLVRKRIAGQSRQSTLCMAWPKGSSGKALKWWTTHVNTLNLLPKPEGTKANNAP